MRPYEGKKRKGRDHRRRINQFRFKKAAKLRDGIGVIDKKKVLKTCFLNVDGLSEATLEDIKVTVSVKSPDIVFLIETKRREEEETGIDISIPGYRVREVRRSDLANDKDGGGIAVYTRLSDGLLFRDHTPNITDPAAAFVANERAWVTVESQSCKTAICGLYMGCQYSDNRNDAWNDTIYRTIQHESFNLRSQGYRIVYLGDFNGHIGDKLGQGVPGNKHDINENGRKFLNFLSHTDSVHINGGVRVPGNWDTRLTTGLWTRQRGGCSSILDFGVVSSEHISSVISMIVDDCGHFGTLSDHNWLFLDLRDQFVKKQRVSNLTTKKSQWNIKDNQDWSGFRGQVLDSVASLDKSSPDKLAAAISASILSALHSTIGLKSDKPFKKPRLLPPALVKEFQLLRSLEKNWKTLNAANANNVTTEVTRAENSYLEQKGRTEELLYLHRSSKRPSILEKCKGGSPRARKNFWDLINPKKKQNTEISAVLAPDSGVVHCNHADIRNDVEQHLLNVFQGSHDKIVPPDNTVSDHAYSSRHSPPNIPHTPDHSYSKSTTAKLPNLSSDAQLETDPSGWLNSDITMAEVKSMISSLKNGKAKGWDLIPNEALKNLPDEMITMITVLFNKIKVSGSLPKGWNRGRITLVHKYGLRELLGNYRPITVIISLSGLYSKVLNARLTKVVEQHNLLGEVQNGFRKERSGSDNSFILDTILWKAKATKSKVHMAFLDISKAYDSVNRSILWSRLSSMGFNGTFLSTLRSLYNDDSVDCMVNGLLTSPIFLRRGLRQGCSLSPMLFALYISDIGNDLTSSSIGFKLGDVTISGLLFADDIVVVAKTADGLKSLLDTVKRGFDRLKLVISHEKSQIISSDEIEWDLTNNHTDVVKPLKQVCQYKYLGVWTYKSMYKTCTAKQKQCVQTAQKYKGSCIYVSRLGPDTVDVIHCTWLNVAIPAILHGCEVIPFCETRIKEIERIHAQVAKFALGLPFSAPNFCAQTELGWKPFRQLLYESQIKFYFRVLYLDQKRWVHQALLDHLSGNWVSPYLTYMAAIRSKLGIFAAPSKPLVWKRLSHAYFMKTTNNTIAHVPWLQPLESLARLPHVCESRWSTVISEFRLGCEGLGNKQPRTGYQRKPYCPVCPSKETNDGLHVLFFCACLSSLRTDTGITSFMTSCTLNKMSVEEAYSLFVTGFDSHRKPISRSDFFERAKCMCDMRTLWLSKW